MKAPIGQILGIVLCFLMLIVGPFIQESNASVITAKRQVMNDMTTFIDEVRDSGTITDEMLDRLYLEVNSHGIVMDIEIVRYSKVVNPDPVKGSGFTYTSYVPADDNREYARGDLIKVKGRAVAYTGSQRIAMAFTNFISPKFLPEFTGRIR